MTQFVDSVDYWYFEPDPSDFDESQKKKIDFEGLRRYFVKIHLKQINSDYYDTKLLPHLIKFNTDCL
jgi:hypothetical protein